MISKIKYGLEEQLMEECQEQFRREYGCSEEDTQAILSSRYLIKILTLVYYECRDYLNIRLMNLYEKSRAYSELTDLQAELAFLLKNYNTCMDIYFRAIPSMRCLVFEFLENSFKRLTLEKKKEEKKVLAGCILKEIRQLVKLNSEKTKSIIQVYIPELQEELVNALNDNEELQLKYLEGIINDEDLVSMKNKLSERSILRFVELMSKAKPNDLLSAFKKNPNFSTEEALEICKDYQVYDCMEYLYERMGNIEESVKIAALRIDRVLKHQDEEEGDDYGYIRIKQILDNVIEICKKNNSEEIWESLLDSFIRLYEEYQRDPQLLGESEVFFYINGEILEHLATNCSIEQTIYLLENKYNNLNMGGKMTKAFINILSNLSHSIDILYLANTLVKTSFQRNLETDYLQKLKPYSTGSVCQTCWYPITKREKSQHYRCGHTYHKECVTQEDMQTSVCVTCLRDESDQFTYYLNTLNPKYPKIKKIKELFERNSQKKFEMSEVFKIEEHENIEENKEGK